MFKSHLTLLAIVALICPFVSVVHAQIDVFSDGTDGILDLNCCGSTTIDLSQAITGNWDDPVAAENMGKGIYDPDVFAVVFKYESVDIDRRTVNFIGHPSGAPVVWLVQNDAVINATINFNGSARNPGPGGYFGGFGTASGLEASAGEGPGGGGIVAGEFGSGGGHAEPGSGLDPGGTYGNPGVFPLTGGSGGSGSARDGRDGGGGGGAFLLAVGGTLSIDGSGAIVANGYQGTAWGGGAGGGIRVVANLIEGLGTIQARGGGTDTRRGGNGHIRIEANTDNFQGTDIPEASRGVPQNPLNIFPSSTDPYIRSISLGGEGVPADPRPQSVDITLADPGTYELLIQAENVPTSGTVTVRITPRRGEEFTVNANNVSGDTALSTWSANLNLESGASNIIVRAELP